MAEAGFVNEEVLTAAREAFVENTEDLVDGTIEVVDEVRANINFKIVGASLFVAGLLIGATGGYLVAKKQLKSFYEDLATKEIADAKVFYAHLNKVDENGDAVSPQAIFEQLHGSEAAVDAVDALRRYQGVDGPVGSEDELSDGEPYDEVRDEELLRKTESKVKRKRDPDPELAAIKKQSDSINVFVDSTFDLEEEIKYRTEDAPYIITHDEYFGAELDYENVSYTYYDTDDTLVDEQDVPVTDFDETIGEDHLVRFGSGSKDKNIVYVRNERMGIDYEIVKSTGSYLEEVLGMLSEEPGNLKHSDQRDARRAFRHGDG